MSSTYDYIICGAGCAGLSLAIRLCSPDFTHKKILLIDRESKDSNDRTWSFWSKDLNPWYTSIIHKSWKNIAFHAEGYSAVNTIYPYSYQTIRGIDFYEFCFKTIEENPQVNFIKEDIRSIKYCNDHVEVVTHKNCYSAPLVFDSTTRVFPEEAFLFVWQHFKGWVIRSEKPCFDSDTATFMDFRIDQGGETRFVYVLPWSEKEALVEATFFSGEICDDDVYDKIIREYIDNYLGITEYQVIETEKGAIPMTTAAFGQYIKQVIPIGTPGGNVKPSTGYAFQRIQKDSDRIIKQLKKGRIPTGGRGGIDKRFLLYDKTLLDVLLSGRERGSDVFSMMFKKIDVPTILKFLDEETSLIEEVGIFSKLPFWSFTRAFLAQNIFRTTQKEGNRTT